MPSDPVDLWPRSIVIDGRTAHIDVGRTTFGIEIRVARNGREGARILPAHVALSDDKAIEAIVRALLGLAAMDPRIANDNARDP